MDRAHERPRRSRAASANGDDAPSAHLDKDIIQELRATSRPGKAEILIKVFSQAAGAFASDDFGEAVRLGEQSKHMALRSPAIRELLGLAYYRGQKWKEAARELAAFRRISGSTEQNPVIGDCYRATARPEKALEYCDEITKVAPAAVFFEGQIVAAGALADMGRLDEALQRIESLELDPELVQEHHLRAWYVLADLLERRGRFTQARRWFEAVESSDPDLTDATERLNSLAERG